MAALLFSNVAPALAADGRHDTAERRLRACLVSGSAGAPRTTLAAAVSAVRSLCTPQIKTLRNIRVAAATANLAEPEASEVAKHAERELNTEIAYAIANFTGLPL